MADLLFALALILAPDTAAPDTAAPDTAAPNTGASATTASAVAPTTSSSPETTETAAQKAERVQLLYDQSCGQRGYGTFNDICETLARQVEAAKREAEREARGRPKTPAQRATTAH